MAMNSMTDPGPSGKARSTGAMRWWKRSIWLWSKPLWLIPSWLVNYHDDIYGPEVT